MKKRERESFAAEDLIKLLDGNDQIPQWAKDVVVDWMLQVPPKFR